jgi:hypothetical protein
MAALGLPSLVIDNAAPDYAQHLTSDVNDAFNRLTLTVASLDSPVFTGDPTAPTPSPGDNDTSIATTAFVSSAVTAAVTPLRNVVSTNLASVVFSIDIIPVDDTIPQNTEGTQILSLTITPTSATSLIKLTGHGWGEIHNAEDGVYAVFSSQSADAIQAGLWYAGGGPDIFGGFSFHVVHAPATTSATTYSVRIGSGSGLGVILNGGGFGGAVRLFGGSSAAYLIAEELPT